MTDLIPWALVAILYALGGTIICFDMMDADREEAPEVRFRTWSYIIATGGWPLLVLVIIIEKLRERRS